MVKTFAWHAMWGSASSTLRVYEAMLRLTSERCTSCGRDTGNSFVPCRDRPMTYALRMLAVLLSLALPLVPPTARASEPVDMILVLAADVSRSVTERKFKLQREGAAAAI